MLRHLLKLRWIAAVVAIFCAVDALAFVGIGAVRAIEGYRILFEGPPWTSAHSPGLELARSLDAFLFAMVFLVFSIGVTTLFIVPPESPMLQAIPAWMRAKNLSHLKFLLWEAILATMVVASAEVVVVIHSEVSWSVLALPGATLILATGLFVSRKGH